MESHPFYTCVASRQREKEAVEIIDVSVPLIEGMPIWPGDPGIRVVQTKNLKSGDSSNISRLNCGVHTGTHIDAPRHFLENGISVDELKLDILIGQAFTAYLPKVDIVTTRELANIGLPAGTKRLLLHTRNSKLWDEGIKEFKKDYVALSDDAARWLVDQGIKLIGVDYLSVQRYNDSSLTHKTLLEAGIVIVEGLNLTGVEQGVYELICLPLKLVGVDGAPVRAVLRRKDKRSL